ncbi:MAG TPA: hypothetical protein VE820_01960 [Sphingomicrobium sp.]|nr:hypothetical protein [Sphingomicrobium sp.]
MKQLMMVTGAAALVLAGQAVAKPGNGHGNGHGGFGFENEGPAYGRHGPVGYGVGGCPPGLAKKHNGCMPPGQAKKLFRVGQRYDLSYGSPYSYGQIPYDLRRQYDLNPRYRYYYDNGYLYQVNPRTMLVQQVISGLLGR